MCYIFFGSPVIITQRQGLINGGTRSRLIWLHIKLIGKGRSPLASLASEGQNCYEICHGWIFDIWCPNVPRFILDHKNRNSQGGSQDIYRYIQGRKLVYVFWEISLAWGCQLGISHNMLKILSQVVEDLLYGMPSNKNIAIHLHT